MGGEQDGSPGDRLRGQDPGKNDRPSGQINAPLSPRRTAYLTVEGMLSGARWRLPLARKPPPFQIFRRPLLPLLSLLPWRIIRSCQLSLLPTGGPCLR